MLAEPIATVEADGRVIVVHDARSPASLRHVMALARSADIGVVVSAGAAATLERVVRAGVVALFAAPPTTAELSDAARDIARGGAYVQPDVVPALLRLTRRALRHDSALASLTTREWEVLRLLARQQTNRAIAQRLYLSEHTVRNHLARIYRKLDVTSRAQAVEVVADAFADAAPGDDDERQEQSD